MTKVLTTAAKKCERAIKLLVSLVFHSAVRISSQWQRMIGKEPAGTCVVLYYHSVTAGQRTRFAAQMDILMRCARPVKSDIRQPLPPGNHHAAIVFHDAFVCVCDNALPELALRGIPSTLFVPSGYLGQPQGWITDREYEDYSEFVVDADRLRSLDKALVTIGSHTISHADLPSLNSERAREELERSKVDLEKLLGHPIVLFAFPYGRQNEALIDLTRQVGYQRIFTIQPELAFLDPEEYVTGSCAVATTDWPLEFRLKLLGAYRWLPATRRLRHKAKLGFQNLFSRITGNGQPPRVVTSRIEKD